jgi:hypothetical protein
MYSVTFNDSNGTPVEILVGADEVVADDLAALLCLHLGAGSPANVTVNDTES